MPKLSIKKDKKTNLKPWN